MTFPRYARARSAMLCVALAAVPCAALAVACAGDSDDPAPAPPAEVTVDGTVIVRPTPTPTTPPADPNLADQLRYEGDFEAAIDVYAVIAATDDGEDARRARFAQAQLLARQGRYEEARVALDAYLREAGAAADGEPARFLHASVLDELDDPQGALASYDAYIAAGGAAAAYAEIERTKMLARLHRAPEAEAAAADVVAGDDLTPAVEQSFMLSMARTFEDSGAPLNALAWYSRTIENGGDEATALARRGAIRRDIGDPAWVDDYRAVVIGYPGSGAALELLAELDAAGVPVGAYHRGYVLYRAFRNGEARASLTAAINAGDNPGRSSYYIAAIDEREGDFAAAIDGYQRAHDLEPASDLADDALWWRARLLQTTGRHEEARATYSQLVTEYPASEYARDAEFHRGMTLYRAGDAAGAAFAWGANAAAATGEDDDEEHARALFWQGRAQLDAGDEDAARATFGQLMEEHPANFYALRAEVILGDNDGSDDDEADLDDDDGADWDDIAEYIEEQYGTHPEDAPAPFTEEEWGLATALEDVNLRPQSNARFQATINATQGDVTELFHITRRLEQEGRVSMAARAASEMLRTLEDEGKEEPPDDLLRVAYPLAYSDLVEDAAEEMGVSPLLLLALVRQESFYDPDAGSHAGALGLTQVIEPTGRAIAADLGVEPFSVDDLFRPKLSLRFGASYIATQLRNFDGNAYHALAAYNGGPGTASNAIDSAGEDLDLFVEDLEFDETRLYVKLVMENFARYRQLYTDADEASLPE